MNIKSIVPIGVRQAARRLERQVINLFDGRRYAARSPAGETAAADFGVVIASRRSLVMKAVPAGWERSQRNKQTTLRIASACVDGAVVAPGGYFSFWRLVGKPSRRKGYLPGMEIRGGRLVETVAGGICQLSNALCWAFLQAGFGIVERHRHGWDLFRDDGRDVPFGSGATVLYPYKDLVVRNPWDFPVRVSAGLAGADLEVRLAAPERLPLRIEVVERKHRFYREGGVLFRANEIWSLRRGEGSVLSEELVFSNTAKVMYEIED